MPSASVSQRRGHGGGRIPAAAATGAAGGGGQADGLHELPLAATHHPSWSRGEIVETAEVQEPMEQVIGQFMLRSPVVSGRLADSGFTAGNDFTS
jgi:hypothetical protein